MQLDIYKNFVVLYPRRGASRIKTWMIGVSFHNLNVVTTGCVYK